MPVYGMPSLLELSDPASCAGLCRALAFQFVELNMDLPQYLPGEADLPALRRAAAEYDIFYTLHLPEGLDVCALDPNVAAGHRRTAAQALDLALELEAPVLNLHLPRGIHFTLPEGKVFLCERYRDRCLPALEDFRRLCEEKLAGTGARICIENTAGFLPFQREWLELLLASPVFGLTLDVGHDCRAEGEDRPVYAAHRDRLCHIHLHDVREGKDHLPLGTGEVDLPAALALAEEQNCRVVVETKTAASLRRSARWLKENCP